MQIKNPFFLFLITFLLFSDAKSFNPMRQLRGRRQRVSRNINPRQRQRLPTRSRRPRIVSQQMQPQQIAPPKPIEQKPKTVVAPAETINQIVTKASSTLTLKGYIHAPENMEKVPEFRILFNGKQTTNDSEGFYAIPTENANIKKYYILISSNIIPTFSGTNTIENLTINSTKNYKFFSCKKSFDQDENEIWTIKEKFLSLKQFNIPENTIILLINPKYVQKLETWKIQFLKGFSPVPKIILNEYISKKKFTKRSVKSLLYSLDSQYFHEPISRETKEYEDNPNLKVSLDQ